MKRLLLYRRIPDEASSKALPCSLGVRTFQDSVTLAFQTGLGSADYKRRIKEG